MSDGTVDSSDKNRKSEQDSERRRRVSASGSGNRRNQPRSRSGSRRNEPAGRWRDSDTQSKPGDVGQQDGQQSAERRRQGDDKQQSERRQSDRRQSDRRQQGERQQRDERGQGKPRQQGEARRDDNRQSPRASNEQRQREDRRPAADKTAERSGSPDRRSGSGKSKRRRRSSSQKSEQRRREQTAGEHRAAAATPVSAEQPPDRPANDRTDLSYDTRDLSAIRDQIPVELLNDRIETDPGASAEGRHKSKNGDIAPTPASLLSVVDKESTGEETLEDIVLSVERLERELRLDIDDIKNIKLD